MSVVKVTMTPRVVRRLMSVLAAVTLANKPETCDNNKTGHITIYQMGQPLTTNILANFTPRHHFLVHHDINIVIFGRKKD